jgi:membrane protein implicated in regulation of membrane protease activity
VRALASFLTTIEFIAPTGLLFGPGLLALHEGGFSWTLSAALVVGGELFALVGGTVIGLLIRRRLVAPGASSSLPS